MVTTAMVVSLVTFPVEGRVTVLVFKIKPVTWWVIPSVWGRSVGSLVKVNAVDKRSEILGSVSDNGSTFLFWSSFGGVVKKATVEEFVGRTVTGWLTLVG